MSPEIANPWLIERAKLPGYSLVRFIDIRTGKQSFQPVRPSRGQTDLSDMEFDGMTYILTERSLEHEERREIIRRADEAWRAGRDLDPDNPQAASVAARAK